MNSTLIEPGFDQTNDEQPGEEPNDAASLQDHQEAWEDQVEDSQKAATAIDSNEASEELKGDGEVANTEAQTVEPNTRAKRTKRLTEFEKNLDIEEFGYSPTLFHFCLPLTGFAYHYQLKHVFSRFEHPIS